MWRLSLAFIVAGPGPVSAQVVARVAAPVAPITGSIGSAGTFAPALTTLSPSLSAPSLSPSSSLALAPALAAPAALAPALAARVVPAAAKLVKPGEAIVPKTALEGLKSELDAPKPDASDLTGGREHATRSFEAKLGSESDASESLASYEEGSFHPLAKVKTPPPAQSGDDGGGPTKSRVVAFNGENFPSVAFRPNEPVESHLVRAIEASKSSIQLSLYEFSARGVLTALKAAKRRGVNVQVILDYHAMFPKNEPGAEYRRRRSEQIWGLLRDGFDIRVSRTQTDYGINHNKFAVFDGAMAEFGSYNWSYTSEKSHYENVLFSTEKERVAALQAYWKYMWDGAVVAQDARNMPPPARTPPPSEAEPSIEFNGIRLPSYLFTPGEALEDTVVAAIDAAKKSVDYAMFSLRSERVVQALARAQKRGLAVRVVIDESQSASEYFKPFSDWLVQQGLKVRVLAGPNTDSDFPMAEKMHNKYVILDGRLVETGSANHTKRASIDNYENAHFLNDPTDVAAFAFTFDHMFLVARSLSAPEAPVTLPTDAELREDILSPPPPKPVPPPAPEDPLPAARTFTFNRIELPTTALVPFDPAEKHIVAAIDAAKKTVKIAIYQFEQQGVLDALTRAKKRGAKVSVVLDRAHVYTTGRSHTGGPRKPRPMIVDLVKSGFDLVLLKGQASGIMHNKFMIADDKLLQTGSYNYTQQSEDDHYENVIFTMEAGRVKHYLKYWKYMRDHAEAVDMEKLEDLLNRTTVSEFEDADASSLEAKAAAEDERTSKFPPPPEDPESPIKLHDEAFPRQIFSPQGGIEAAILRAIEAARETIDVAMFSFYSQKIAEALLVAKERGIKVRLALDRSQSALAKLDDWFAWHGFDIRLVSGPDDERDPLYQKMHNKMMIVDGALLQTGSFNYSPNAEQRSFENVNFYDERDMLARYAAYFGKIFAAGFAARPPRREPVFVAPSSGLDS